MGVCMFEVGVCMFEVMEVVHQVLRRYLSETPLRESFVALGQEWRGEVVQLSWSPRAFLYKKLLSDEECDHLTNGVSWTHKIF